MLLQKLIKNESQEYLSSVVYKILSDACCPLTLWNINNDASKIYKKAGHKRPHHQTVKMQLRIMDEDGEIVVEHKKESWQETWYELDRHLKLVK